MKKTMSFDTLMNAALIEYQKDYMASLPSKAELAQGYKPDAGFLEKLEASAKKAAKPKHRPIFYVRRVAACLVLALALTTVMFAPVQAVQQAVVSTVLDWKEKFTAFLFTTGEGNINAIPQSISLGYLPEGYENGEVILHESEYYLYQSIAPDGGMLMLEIRCPDGTLNIDNEQAEYYIIEHNGYRFTWIESTDGSSAVLVWTSDSLVYTITASLPLIEVLEIAQNIFL